MKLNTDNRDGQRQQGFTLVEMLVVIAIIAILAAMLFPVFGNMQKNKAKKGAQAQLSQLDTLIQDYYSRYNSYPLDNPDRLQPNHTAIHPLYYELMGTTFNTALGRYETLTENITESNVRTYFNQDGLRNVTHDPNNPQAVKAKQFFTSVNADMYRSLDTGATGPDVKLLRFPIKDVEANMLKDTAGNYFNPWRYISTNPTNNQGRYDLWLEFEVGGSRYRVSNWEKEPITLETPAK